MTERIKKNSRKMFVAGFAVSLSVLAVMMAFSQKQQPQAPPRELVLVAKEMVFRDTAQPNLINPTLVLKRSQPVKLVVRNEEPGPVLHCFIIGGLEVKTSHSLSPGESEALAFTPSQKGRFAYACLMHPGMSGRILVE
ncbi:MAG TPA: cupredoxin domain-containing protein [Chthoniobacterales bacterium]